jgi:putative spermidine/putrescine transport system substrate-binding protein
MWFHESFAVFKEAPKSWAVVFEETTLPDGKSNKGRVQAFDGPIYIADAALYLMTHKPELGIKDPYELTEVQVQGAGKLSPVGPIASVSAARIFFLRNVAC